MNDRQRKIDDFLKFFRDICKQNPDYELNSNNVYSELINLGLPDDEKKKLIEDSLINGLLTLKMILYATFLLVLIGNIFANLFQQISRHIMQMNI